MRRPATLSAQFLGVGQGGIARAARLSVKALQECTDVEALSVQDRQCVTIGRISVSSFSNHRLRFVFANTAHLLRGRRILYDFPGTARAHPPFLRSRQPYALWIHGIEVWGYPTPRPDYFPAVRAADLVLANSEYTLNRAQEYLGPLPRARQCWLATEDDDEPPVIDGRSATPPTVLFVGRSDNLFAKGQDILIDIWPQVVSKVPDARLVFVGGGSHLHKLRDMAAASPARENIDVRGFVSEAQMDGLWRDATAFAMLSEVEGFGLVFVEAMRYGKPIIASTNDASEEINVDCVTGYNLARNRKSDITDRIIHLLKNRDDAAALGRSGLGRWKAWFRFSAFQRRFDQATADWLGEHA
ncbi:phosphatidylinositol alpha-1,6-mannosyltransferase [Rhizobiales bacterium GAS191]|nr:phosphatidylinositol alpha-1,6-mannosyltransferase [Rhizobiales bacterium GAS191]